MAEERRIGPAGAHDAPPPAPVRADPAPLAATAAPPRNDHLLAVLHPRHEVDANLVRPARQPASALHRLFHARARGKLVHAWAPHLARDLHHDPRATPARAGRGHGSVRHRVDADLGAAAPAAPVEQPNAEQDGNDRGHDVAGDPQLFAVQSHADDATRDRVTRG